MTGKFTRNLTREDIRDAVKGKSRDAAKSTLSERYGIDGAEVSVSPGWAPRVPRFGFRIEVEFRGPAATKATSESNSKNDATPTSSSTAGARP